MKIIKTLLLLALLTITFQRTLRKKAKKTSTKKKLDSQYFVWIDVAETSNWSEGYIYPSKISDQNNDENKRGIIIKVDKMNNEFKGYVTQSGTNYIFPYRKISSSFSYEMPWTAYNYVKFFSNGKVLRFKTNAIDNDDGQSITSSLNSARTARRQWVSSKVSSAQGYANQYSTKAALLAAAKGGQATIASQITKQNADITTATNTLNTLKTNLATATTNRSNKEKEINTIKQQMADLTTKININDELSANYLQKQKELQDQVTKGNLDASTFQTQMNDSKTEFEEHMGHLRSQLLLQTAYETVSDQAKAAVLNATPDLATFKTNINKIIA